MAPQREKVLKIVTRDSVFGARADLYRVIDNRCEASGFTTKAEAQEWAKVNGYVIEEVSETS